MAPVTATAAARAHNGTHLLDSVKTWGAHKLLGSDVSNGPPHAHRRCGGSGVLRRDVEEEEEYDDDGGLEEVRVRLLDRLRAAAERVQLPVVLGVNEKKVEPAGEKPSAAAVVAGKPWNLRSRKGGGGGGGHVDEERSARKAPERRKFAVELTSDEIAEDIYAVTGSLPRRRPKKRARAVQRRLDALFPGSWLTEASPDLYKVPFPY